MTVGALKKWLKGQGDDVLVAVSSDEEGNSYGLVADDNQAIALMTVKGKTTIVMYPVLPIEEEDIS